MSGSTRILFRCFRKEWRAFGIAMVSTVLLTLAALAGPVPLALVIDRVVEKSRGASPGFELTDSDLWLLAFVGGLVLGIALIQGVVSYVSDVSLTRASERIVHELRLRTHMHLQRLSLRFHARRPTGDLVTRVTGDVNAVGSLFADSLATVFSSVLLLTGMVVVSLIIDPVLALVAFAVTPLLGLVSFTARRKLREASRRARAQEGEIASLTAESFAAIREVKAFGSEPYEHGRLRSKSEERLRAGYDLARIQGRFSRVVDVIGSFGTAAVLVVGVFRVSSGAIGPGELVIMVSYAGKVYRPLRDIARQVSRISRSMARAERITEILAADDVLEERPGAYDGPPARGALELDSVSFSYETERRALDNVSLKIEAGERLALVGPSGAGKSTVAALIARFYDPTSGRVLVDGLDVRDCSLAWLRRQIGLVLQDTVLFSGSVAENIAYGLEVRQDEIEAAAKVADAHDFISELPEGYETELGQRGVGLSGGQRQRIAIARTLLRDPAILILDEPTTGLDARSEAEVMDGFASLMRGRTTVIISHSERLLKRADRAISIEDGRIVPGSSANGRATNGGGAKGLVRTVADRLLNPEKPARIPSRPPPRRAPVPVEPALPALPVLLDPDDITPFLQRSLGLDAPSADVRIHHVRYIPGRKVVVRYDVGLDGTRSDAVAMIATGPYLARRAVKAKNLALARLVRDRSPASMPLRYESELDALIQWYPLDLELPALAEPPRRLFDELDAAGAGLGEFGDDPTTLAYKPRRRAVLRMGDHVVKMYASQQEYASAAVGLQVAGRVLGARTPAAEGGLPARLVTVQTLLPGTRPTQPGAVAMQAGELLHELQTAWVPVDASARRLAVSLPAMRGSVGPAKLLLDGHASDEAGLYTSLPSHQLATAEASATYITAILPELRPRLEALLGRLEATMPSIDRLVLCHGDFCSRQLLVTPDGLSVVDFDAMRLAPAALDPATYAAHLVSGDPGDLDSASEALEKLLEGYGGRPRALSWYLASSILRHSRRPFRYLEPQWPDRVEGMVTAAEDALRR